MSKFVGETKSIQGAYPPNHFLNKALRKRAHSCKMKNSLLRCKPSTLALLTLVLLSSGCRKWSHQDVTPLTTYISFASSVNGDEILRASGTTFDIDDRIGVFGYEAGTATPLSSLVNAEFVTGGSGLFAPVGHRIPYPDGDKRYDFFAYYPYSDFSGTTSISLDIRKQEDFMYSDNLKNVPKGTYSEHELVFRRQMSKVILNLSATNEEVTITTASVVFKGVTANAVFDLKAGTLTPSPEKTDIEARVSPVAGGINASVMLFPTLADGIKAEIKIGEKTYEWSLDRALKAGTNYRFDIKIEGTEVITTQRSEYEEVPIYTKGGAAPNSIKVLHFMNSRWLLRSDNFGPRNFMVLYDKENKIPYWIAHPLHPSYMTKKISRTDKWQYDPAVARQYQPNLKNAFRHTPRGTIARGHLFPSGDRTHDKLANEMTFYYTNMAAQYSTFNSGQWNSLEGAVRKWTEEYGDTVYVVTGVILEHPIKETTTDKDGHTFPVPDYYYKAIMKKPKGKTPKCIAFKMPNHPSNAARYESSVITVEELERITGFTYFPSVTDPSAKRIKSISEWRK